MTLQEGEELKLTAAKTSYGDLVQQGIASIMNIIWEGEFDTKDPSHPKFKAGYSYRASIKVMLDTKGPFLLEACVMEEGNVLPMTPPGGSVNQMLLEC